MSKYWTSKRLELFSGADQFGNFGSLASIFPCRVLRRAAEPVRMREGQPLELPDTYAYLGRTFSTSALLSETDTAGMIVLQRGRVVFEQYFRGHSERDQWAVWSVTKSFMSALVGIALAQGAIERVDDPVVRYVPKLTGSAYDGVSIQHVLQMSSGVRWSEDYTSPASEVRRSSEILAFGGSRDAWASTLSREYEPGSFHRYASIEAGESALPVGVWAKQWWPLLLVLVGVAIIVIGGILFSP